MSHTDQPSGPQGQSSRRYRPWRIPRKPAAKLPGPEIVRPHGGRNPNRPKSESLERVHKWRQRNPERQIALSKVAHAIKNHDLDRRPCERCGGNRNVVAGPITLAPLRVTWLCRSCSSVERRMNKGVGRGRQNLEAIEATKESK